MKKNGFAFVETIIAVVVLSTSLLLLYSSFNKVLHTEKTKIYYDDTAFIYRSYYLKNTISGLNYNNVVNYLLSNDDEYFVITGSEHTDLIDDISDEDIEFFNNLINRFNVSQMVFLKENKINDIKTCSNDCDTDDNICKECKRMYNTMSDDCDDFINYIKTVFVDVSSDYILAVEYKICEDNSNCKKYYSWVSV